MVAATISANELRILALAVQCASNEDAQLQCDSIVILLHTALRTGHSPGEARVDESPSRRVAHFS